MEHATSRIPVVLAEGGVLELHDATGQLVNCLEGDLWLTQQHDRRDIVLHAGQSFVLDRRGLALVNALGGPARVSFGGGTARVALALPAAGPASHGRAAA